MGPLPQTFKLVWHDTPDDIIAQYEQTVRDDLMRYVIDDIEQPNDLVFHLVFLTKDYDGPNVIVWGKDDAYHCQYEAVTKWSSDDGQQ
jgi:hypothetical protein